MAVAANTSPAHVEGYFSTKASVVMAVLDDVLTAIAEALEKVERKPDPEQALLTATLEVVHAVIAGSGVTTIERLGAVAGIISTDIELQHQVRELRERILSVALAEHLGTTTGDDAVRLAMSRWSAIAAAAYSMSAGAAHGSDRDNRVDERVTAEFAANYFDVMHRRPR